jgi:hypothetical protein
MSAKNQKRTLITPFKLKEAANWGGLAVECSARFAISVIAIVPISLLCGHLSNALA